MRRIELAHTDLGFVTRFLEPQSHNWKTRPHAHLHQAYAAVYAIYGHTPQTFDGRMWVDTPHGFVEVVDVDERGQWDPRTGLRVRRPLPPTPGGGAPATAEAVEIGCLVVPETSPSGSTTAPPNEREQRHV